MTEAAPVPGADAGQGGAPPAPAATPAQGATPPAADTPSAEQKPWYSDIQDNDLRGWVELKGWKNVEEQARSAFNLEKLRGVPENQLLKLPADLSDTEAMKPVLEKIGYVAPANVDDYGFTAIEGVDVDFAKAAQSWMHEAGVPKAIAAQLAQKQIAWQMEQNAAYERDAKQAQQQEEAQLRAEWGANYDAMLEQARAVKRLAGLTAEQIATIEESVGYSGLLKAFANLGAKIGESGFVTGADKPQFTLSPDAARAQINQLKSDADFAKKLRTGDMAAKAKWTQLHQIAYPEQGASQ